MKKYSNGKLVDMSAEEVAEFKAMQAAIKEPVPQTISRRQGKQALFLDGSLEKVQELIDGIEDPMQKGMAQIYWDTASDFERSHPMVELIGQGLGKDAEALDQLFRIGGGL